MYREPHQYIASFEPGRHLLNKHGTEAAIICPRADQRDVVRESKHAEAWLAVLNRVFRQISSEVARCAGGAPVAHHENRSLAPPSVHQARKDSFYRPKIEHGERLLVMLKELHSRIGGAR